MVKRRSHNGLAWSLGALAAAILAAGLVAQWYREYLAARRPDPAHGAVHPSQATKDITVYLSWRQLLMTSPELYLIAGGALLVVCALLSSKAVAEFRWARVLDRQHAPPPEAARGFRKEVLKQLRASGSDTNQPHTFEFFLYLPTESAAETAAQRLRESDFLVQVSQSGSGNGWLCKAEITLVPVTSSLNEIGHFFEQLAGALDGDFDGWESAVMPAKSKAH